MRESFLKLANEIRDAQTNIENDVEATKYEQREMRVSLSSMAASQEEISMSLHTLTELQETLIKKLLPISIGMVFVLALLFAGVRFYEITALFKPGYYTSGADHPRDTVDE